MTVRCPVCRATQTLRQTCRRCQADLRLLVLANRRLAYIKRELEQARAEGNTQRVQACATELGWLSPLGSESARYKHDG